jgi:hypothetical protein
VDIPLKEEVNKDEEVSTISKKMILEYRIQRQRC